MAKRIVEIQGVSDDQVLATNLNAGELLAISGMTNLAEGTQVNVQQQ